MSDTVFPPVTWQDVAPLLERWRLAVFPNPDGTWDVLTGYAGGASGCLLRVTARCWTDVPQAIADVAAQCAAGEGGG